LKKKKKMGLGSSLQSNLGSLMNLMRKNWMTMNWKNLTKKKAVVVVAAG
jgi:hypothetical protein